SFTFDTTSPAVAVTSPANGSFKKALSAVTGSSSDATAGVSGVTVTIQKHGDANGFWNGTSFSANAGGATVFTASNTGTAFSTWSANTSGVPFADGQQYTINVSAADGASNSGAASSSFTFDSTAPTVSVASPANNSFRNALASI